MEFYKKTVKNKEVANVLNEKEYKCVSLQAIIPQIVKENNDKLAKELIEEINEHLSDLKLLPIDNERNKERCQELISKFEVCLVKIITPNAFGDLLTFLNKQLEESKAIANEAVGKTNVAEIRAVEEKIERNLEVLRQFPEVKNKSPQFLVLVKSYEELLDKIKTHVRITRIRVSRPISHEEFPKVQEKHQQNNPPLLPPNKVALTKIEQKMTRLRQILSNDDETKEPQKYGQIVFQRDTKKPSIEVNNLSQTNKSKEPIAVKSGQSNNLLIPPRVQYKIDRTKQRILVKNDGEVAEGNLRKAVSESNKERRPVEPIDGKNTDFTNELDGEQSLKAKGNVLYEKPKPGVKSANPSPPRTPTHMRKLFNMCVSSSNSKSIEDLPTDYNSVFEKELKSIQLKPRGFNHRLENFRKREENDVNNEREDNGDAWKKNIERKKPLPVPRRTTSPQDVKVKNNRFLDVLQLREQENLTVGDNINRSEDPQSIINRTSLEEQSIITITNKPTDNNLVKPSDRSSFTTFRSSIDSLKDFSGANVMPPTNPNQNDVEKVLKDLTTNLSSLEKTLTDLSTKDITKLSEYNVDIEEFNVSVKKFRKRFDKSVGNGKRLNDNLVFKQFYDDIDNIENNIRSFKGFKHDSAYSKIDTRLAKYYVDIEQLRINPYHQIEKNDLLQKLKRANDNLEQRVVKNKVILQKVLEDQAELIAVRHGIV